MASNKLNKSQIVLSAKLALNDSTAGIKPQNKLLQASDVENIMQFVHIQCFENLEQLHLLKTPLQTHRFVLPLIQNILDFIIE